MKTFYNNLKKKRKLIILIVMFILFCLICGKVYARYVIQEHKTVTISSTPFYFGAEADEDTIELSNSEGNLNLLVSNNNGTYYNDFNTNYEVSLIGNNKFTFAVDNVSPTNNVVTKVINGASLLDNNLSFKVIKNTGVTTNDEETVTIKIASTTPYAKEIEIPITIYDLSMYDYPVNNGSGVYETTRISPTNTVQIGDLLNMSFAGKNFEETTITSMKVNINYTSKTGSGQSINVILTHNGRTYTQSMDLPGKTTNGTVTVTFTGLNIPIGDNFTVTTSVKKLTNSNITINRKYIDVNPN